MDMETSIKQSILNHVDLCGDVPAWIAAVKAECAEFDQSYVNEVLVQWFCGEIQI